MNLYDSGAIDTPRIKYVDAREMQRAILKLVLLVIPNSNIKDKQKTHWLLSAFLQGGRLTEENKAWL
ncbi:MAG: hypothetical protein KAJ03_11790, partial [Gammaproteobacteria bacterium]|nr:hypothetical protein [Gammaproteobacteria bacterium]